MHPKIIESISNKQIYEDIDMIEYFNNHSSGQAPYMKLYCSSRDEAIELYNKLILKDKEKMKKIR